MNKLNSKTLHVVVVVDGRPGHEKQSYGIVHWLSKKMDTQQCVVDVSGRSFGKQVLAFLQMATGVGHDIDLSFTPDLVIGTGTRTHATVLALKRQYSIPAITCMTPGKVLRNMFDICFVPEHDGGVLRKNYVYTTGAPNPLVNQEQHCQDKGLILLGGVDTKSHIWNQQDIENKVKKIVANERGIHWTISSSPRTPAETVIAMEKLGAATDNARFFDYKDTHRGWIEQRYAESATVWVTTDSISMLYEALTAGCRVHIIPMQWVADKSKFKRNEELLTTKGLVIPFAAWEEGAVRQTKNPQLNEAQRCADYILDKWWPEHIR